MTGLDGRPKRPPTDDTPWHVMHTVEGPGGLVAYQLGGPAEFLIWGDEIEGLMALLAGIQVDEALQAAAPHTRIYPGEQ